MNRNRVLFLDRDGVINYDAGYTSNIENFKFIDGIFDLCKAAIKAGYLLIVVTNQAGIGRGYYSEQDFFKLTAWMCDQFATEGLEITDVFYCPDHPEHGIGPYKRESINRKPNPGMLLQADEKYCINFSQSIMIGDKNSDMQAANNAGVGIRCHYLAKDTKGVRSVVATHEIHSLRDGIALLTNETNKLSETF